VVLVGGELSGGLLHRTARVCVSLSEQELVG